MVSLSLLVGLASIGSARLHEDRTLAVEVACEASASQACAGTLKAKIGRKAAGRKRYNGVKPGKRRTVTLALSKRGRALVRKVAKGRKVKFVLALAVTGAAGKGLTAKRTVSVRR